MATQSSPALCSRPAGQLESPWPTKALCSADLDGHCKLCSVLDNRRVRTELKNFMSMRSWSEMLQLPLSLGVVSPHLPGEIFPSFSVGF